MVLPGSELGSWEARLGFRQLLFVQVHFDMSVLPEPQPINPKTIHTAPESACSSSSVCFRMSTGDS